jgi:hypothetical protein
MNDSVLGALSPSGVRFPIQEIFVELLLNYAENCVISEATPRISIGLQIRDREVKEGLKLHLSHIDHIAIRSELRYLI